MKKGEKVAELAINALCADALPAHKSPIMDACKSASSQSGLDTSCTEEMIKEIRALSDQIANKNVSETDASSVSCDFSSREEVLTMVLTGEPRAVVEQLFDDEHTLVATFAEFYPYLFRTDELAAVLCTALSCDNEARCVGAARLLSMCIEGSRGNKEWVGNEGLISTVSDALRHPPRGGFSRAVEERKRLGVVVSQKRTSLMVNPFKLRFSVGKNHVTTSRDEISQCASRTKHSPACDDSDESAGSDTSSPFTLDTSGTSSSRPQVANDSGSDLDLSAELRKQRPQSVMEERRRSSPVDWLYKHVGMIFSSSSTRKSKKPFTTDNVVYDCQAPVLKHAASELMCHTARARTVTNDPMSGGSSSPKDHRAHSARSRSASSNALGGCVSGRRGALSSSVDVCASDTELDTHGKHTRGSMAQRSCQDLRSLKKQSCASLSPTASSSSLLLGSRCSVDISTLSSSATGPVAPRDDTLTAHGERLRALLTRNEVKLVALALTRCEWSVFCKIDMDELLCGNHDAFERSRNLKAWVDRFNDHVAMLISCMRMAGSVLCTEVALKLIAVAQEMRALNNPSGVAQICIALHDRCVQEACEDMGKPARSALTKLSALVPSGDNYLQCTAYENLLKGTNGPFVPNPYVIMAQLNFISSTPMTDSAKGRTRYSLSGLSLVHAFVRMMGKARGRESCTSYTSNAALEQCVNKLHMSWMELDVRGQTRFSKSR